ncbi:MAG TPA: ROK family protein [Candidatus Paceibacterota bacterium]
MTIGIDIGGSKIIGILWNGKKVVRSFEVRTPKSLEKFKSAIKKIFKNLNTRGLIKKIGIGTAGSVEGTKVIRARNIPYFDNFDFHQFSPAHGGAKLRVDNDARCLARSEYTIGAGKGAKSVLFITLGTGIGRAYGKNNKILKIKQFEKSESWEKDYQKIKDKKELAEFLGEKLFLIADALNPEIIVLGGGVVKKKGYYEAIENALRVKSTGSRVKKSKLGKFAGAIGGAMLWKNSA